MNITPKIGRRQAEICLELVQEMERCVVDRRQSVDQVLARFYRQHREYGARDRRFFSNAVFSWFRWRGWLKTPDNKNIALAILLDAEEVPPQMEYMYGNLETLNPQHPTLASALASFERSELNVVRPGGSARRKSSTLNVGSCRLQRSNSMPADAGSTFAGIEPLGPLNFEDKMQRLQSLLKTGPLRIEQLTPDWVSDFLFIPGDSNPEIHLRQCLESFQTRPPTWLRLPLCQYEKELHLLEQTGFEIETHSFMKQAVFIKSRKNFDADKFPEIEIQDLASQCVGICCDPKPGEKWWDVCAGAGGKSLHLVDWMQDRGQILATDVRPAILPQLSKRLLKHKYRCVKSLVWDGKSDPSPGKYFDGVLVDAPCSGLGTWGRNPDARWRTYPEQIRDYVGIQQNLLQIAAKKVGPAGRLVYSTCTLTRTENTDVIAAFLEQNRAFQLEKIINPLNHEAPCGSLMRRSSSGYGGQDVAEPSEAKRVMPPHTNSASGQDFLAKEGEPADGIIWVWPWEGNCNGMFIAVMKKA